MFACLELTRFELVDLLFLLFFYCNPDFFFFTIFNCNPEISNAFSYTYVNFENLNISALHIKGKAF